MKVLLTIGLAIFCSTVLAQADFERALSVSWDINTPLLNRDYINRTSTRGFRVGYYNSINEKFFMGVDFNNATFDDYKPRKTYYSETGAITTDVFDYTYSYGLAVTGGYKFAPLRKLSPFVSFGAGANYNSYKRYFNIFSDADSSWGLLLRPEAGVIVKMGARESWGLLASAHLDYSTAKSTMVGYEGIASVGFRLGLIIFEW